MNDKAPDELYISFLFPPSNLVSGINVFKRIVENGKAVDVLQANIDLSDFEYGEIEEFIDNRIFIDIDCDDDGAKCIFKFVKRALNSIEKDYKRIYSRSWFASNHFLASEYKFKNPDVFWTAEFSDPLIFDLSNNVKNYKKMIVDNPEYIDRINHQIEDFNKKNDTSFGLIENKSSGFFICEYLVYLFADKIIFTNENQKEIMLNQFPVDIADFVSEKCEVRMHHTLDSRFYHIKESSIDLNDDYINIAYFGKDYNGQRHFESLFYSIESLNHKFKDKLRIYMFVDDDRLIDKLISPLDSYSSFIVEKPMDYFEFLNACLKFDVLIVNDMVTKGAYEKNPYLPSKLSDYLGSGTDIWALYEKNSCLSKFNLKYMSEITDFDQCGRQLVKILADRGYADDDFSFDDDYFIKRLTTLNEFYEKEYHRKLALKRKFKDLKRENKKLNKENNDIVSSNSWKITKPFRKFRNK